MCYKGIKMKILLDKNKEYFKANMHAHSNLSDGNWSVEKLKEEYKKRGYSIIAITDHEHLINHNHIDDEKFLTIPSCEMMIKEYPEYSSGTKQEMKVAHFNFYSLDKSAVTTPCYFEKFDVHTTSEIKKKTISSSIMRERVYSKECICQMIKTAKDEGYLVSYNHPTWSNESAIDYLRYEGVDFVEVYNNSCTKTLGLTEDEHAFDDFLKSGKKVYCFCTDDNHNKKEVDSPYFDSFGGWIQINADRLDYQTIMNALKEGSFYASTGAEIYSLTVDGDKVEISTSKAKRITLTTNGRKAQNLRAKEGEYLEKAEFTIKEDYEYIRITVEDEHGKKAYTQPYYCK